MSGIEELRQSLKPLRHQRSDIQSNSREKVYTPTEHTYDSDYGSSYAQPSLQRKHHSISAKKNAGLGQADHYLNSQSSISSISSIMPHSAQSEDRGFAMSKKKHHQSMVPPSRYDVGSLGHMSAFDPFGNDHTPSTASPLTPISAQPLDRYSEKKNRRSTIKPLPKTVNVEPFEATLIGKTVKPSPTSENTILVTLQFGFSTEDPPRNDNITIPFLKLKEGGGELVRWLEGLMPPGELPSGQPEMTDGSSADESDLESEYDLNNLLRWMRLLGMS